MELQMTMFNCFIVQLLRAARRHENDPLDEQHAAKVDQILKIINSHAAWATLLEVISDCEFILQRPFHPLPEWVTDRLAADSCE